MKLEGQDGKLRWEQIGGEKVHLLLCNGLFGIVRTVNLWSVKRQLCRSVVYSLFGRASKVK